MSLLLDFGDVEDVLLSPLTGQPLPEHPLNFGNSTSLSSTNAFNASTSLQGCYSTSPIHGDSVNASIQRLDGLASMVSPGFSFGSPKKNVILFVFIIHRPILSKYSCSGFNLDVQERWY